MIKKQRPSHLRLVGSEENSRVIPPGHAPVIPFAGHACVLSDMHNFLSGGVVVQRVWKGDPHELFVRLLRVSFPLPTAALHVFGRVETVAEKSVIYAVQYYGMTRVTEGGGVDIAFTLRGKSPPYTRLPDMAHLIVFSTPIERLESFSIPSSEDGGPYSA